jgi:uncharacterized protein DUF5715
VTRKIVLLLVISAAAVVAVWALLLSANRRRQSQIHVTNVTESANPDAWAEAVEKVKEPRVEPSDATTGIETPPELRHYSDRHWFLATQVAEVVQHNLRTCQDYVDLAGMIERDDMVSVPAVTDSYVLFGVGQKADVSAFTRWQDKESIELYSEAQLSEVSGQLNERRTSLQSEMDALKRQATTRKKRDRNKESELQKEITAKDEELKAVDEQRKRLDEFYGKASSREKLLRDYQSLQTLAKNFGGRSYNLDDSSDRQAMKVNMLRSLRPVALKVMEEVAAAYHRQFNRPLPVSSLVRTEEYQHALSRVNRNAVLIDIPPHSTGLAFDIDYRYMSPAEQNFVMAELARLEREGRIEVIRESNANYHVFAFLDGRRPSDDLIAASLEDAKAPVQATHHAASKPKIAKSKGQRAKSKPIKSKTRRRR